MTKLSQNIISGFAVLVSVYIVFVYSCDIVPVATGGAASPMCGGSKGTVSSIAEAASHEDGDENSSEDSSEEGSSDEGEEGGSDSSDTTTTNVLSSDIVTTVFETVETPFPFNFDDNTAKNEDGKIVCRDDGDVLQWDSNDNEWECRAPVYTVFDDVDDSTVKVLDDGAIECRESNELLRWNGEADEWECASLTDIEDRDPTRGPAGLSGGLGSEIYFTDNRGNTTSVDIRNHETTTTLGFAGTTLSYVDEDGVTHDFDLSSIDTDTTYTAGTGLQLLGTEFSVAPGGITSNLIANNSIRAIDIAPNAVGNSELAPFSVGLFNMRPGSVGPLQILPGAVGPFHIRPNAINRFHIGANQVRDSEIDYASVTLADFTNDAGFITSETDDQTIALTGDTLAIEDGNSVDLSKYIDSFTAGDGIKLVGTAFGINAAACVGTDKLQWTGTGFTCTEDVDTDTTYTAGTGLQLNGTQFFIPRGAIGSGKIRNNSIRAADIGANAVRDSEIDYTQVTLADFTNDAGFLTAEIDGDTTNELVNNFLFTPATSTLTLEDAGGITNVDLSPLATDLSPSNELITTMSFNPLSNLLEIAEGGTPSFFADLSSLNNAGTDDQTISLTGTTLAIEDGNSVDLAELFCDADGDTCFHVEKNAGENLLRFDIAGTEQFVMDGPQLLVKNSGQSVFLGDGAGANDDLSNNRNTLIGQDAGQSIVGESYNTFVGYLAGQNFTLGTAGGNNTFIGRQAGQNASTVHGVGIGRDALKDASGTGSVALGYRAGEDATGDYGTFLGYNAGRSNVSGTSNIFIGQGAGRDSTAGNYNLVFGHQAGLTFGAGADDNLFFGRFAGRDNTTGAGNITLGYQANLFNETGSNNVIIGRQAGRGTALHNKSGNVFIGNQAGYDETGSNRLHIDNARTAAPLIYGEFDNDRLGFNGDVGIGTGVAAPAERLHVIGNILATGTITPSDERFKDDVEEVDSALANLLKIRGTTYDFTDDAQIGLGVVGKKQYGVIAQEVEEVFPDLVHRYDFDGDGSKDYRAVNYTGFTPVIIEALRELNDDTTERLATLEGEENATQEDLRFAQDEVYDEIDGLRALISQEGIGGLGNLVADAWEITKNIVFKAGATFENAVAFLGRVTFMDRVTFADRDLAGYAEIEEGDDDVDITYENAFAREPVVTVTSRTSGVDFQIEDESEKGFTIRLSDDADDDILFSWIALSIADPKTFSSDGDGKDEDSDEQAEDAHADAPSENLTGKQEEDSSDTEEGDTTEDKPEPTPESQTVSSNNGSRDEIVDEVTEEVRETEVVEEPAEEDLTDESEEESTEDSESEIDEQESVQEIFDTISEELSEESGENIQ